MKRQRGFDETTERYERIERYFSLLFVRAGLALPATATYFHFTST